jgi:uncharacterized protein (TIGR02217 family)
MTIQAYRLPEGIERGSEFGPTFKNVIQESVSGNEQRFAQWTKCRGVGNISYGLQTSEDPVGDFRVILSVWRAHFGSLIPFRFKDWSDHAATDETFGTGDASETQFQLSKTYDPSLILLNTPGSLFYVRDITLVASTPVIEVDGVTQVVTTDYNISPSGLVTFTTPPGVNKLVTWSGEFDVPVRFDTDQLPVVVNEADLTSLRAIPIKEVIGES